MNGIDLNKFCANLKDAVENSKGAILFYDDFLKELLKRNNEKTKREYPYVIKMAKPLKDLLKGDFEPAYEIVVREPFKYEEQPIWSLQSSKGIEAHFGFENSDRRYFSGVGFDDMTPHGTLAGTTGSGKSVCINGILFNIFFNYAPWEVELYMSDAKIAEFMRYGITHQIPHIKVIAATEDTSFALSMLDKLIGEMNQWNVVFASVGVSNLEDFRKKTGLTVPRKLFVMDEYQFMLKQAGKKASVVTDKLDVIGRAGRSAGVHMFLASQEVGQEVKGGILNNMKMRCCLVADSNVSELILGNSEAAQLSGKGTLILNTNPSRKSVLDNKRFQVPFQDKDVFERQGLFIQDCGNRSGYKPYLHFYNENKALTLSDINSLSEGLVNEFVLGEPSQMTDDPHRFKIPVDFSDINNALFLTSSPKDCGRYFHTVLSNKVNKAQHKILLADPSMIWEPLEGFMVTELKSTQDMFWGAYRVAIYRQKLLLEVEKNINARGLHVDPVCVELYNELFAEFRNELNYSRVFYALELMETSPVYQESLNVDGSERTIESRKKHLKSMIEKIFETSTEFAKVAMTPSNLPPLFIHVVGLNRIVGLVRDANYKEVANFKKLLMDASDANVMFFLYTTSLEDITEVRSGIKHVIVDKAESEYLKLKTEVDYPMSVTKVTAVYCDKITKKLMTFKKVTMEGE